jgi:molecular chaperone HscB
MTDHPDHAAAPAARTDASEAGVMAKCRACKHELRSAAVCDYCHTLNPAGASTDYCALLGVPRRYDLDAEELRRRYLELSRHAHPDFYTGSSDESQALALTVSSSLNDAYRTLSDPFERAEYLEELLGGPSSAADKSTPDGFLDEMMVLQEELTDARLSGDHLALETRGEKLRARLAAMMARIAELFADFEAQVGCEGIRLECLGRIRRQLNAVSYIRRLVSMTGGT